MQQNTNEHNKITITDVAEALGISKTTVSRAISGKGRIGENTRKRVLDYIEANNYKPNPIAKGLAQSKTYNIGWVMPGDSTVTDLPFFQSCMIGVGEVATAADYDILISMVYDNDISQLERVVKNNKVDGVILGRTLVNDDRIDFLTKNDVPFVVIGSTDVKGVIQIDNNHVDACRELTAILIMKGVKKLALIGGGENHVVNRTRRIGFERGLESQNIPLKDGLVYMNNENEVEVERAVDDALRSGAECIICMDDRICYSVIGKLRKDGISVPGQVKVASFYNSAILENNQPAITALQYDPKELGAVACKTLLDYIDGKQVADKVMLSYEVVLKGSTQ
jgi:DNA-binding LacI/PurR family transcriptional regulator